MNKKTFFFMAALLGSALWTFTGNVRPAARAGIGWTSEAKIACAYFFYWYDVYSGAHFKNPDGSDALTDHPPLDAYSRYTFTDPAWCRGQLLDMMAARIDVVLPVYWGDHQSVAWSKPGLQNLVSAALQLSAEGVVPPRFGLFLDTASFRLQLGGRKPDLTKPNERAMVYKMISDYWRLVPRDFWALVDGKPLVFFYTADAVSDYNQRTFDTINLFFQRDFGTTPFIIRESSWDKVRTDGAYVWGVAFGGPRTMNQVGSLGPGYNDRAVANRPIKQFRDRECGDVYNAAWDEIATSGVRIAAIETWNEWHEATEVAPSYEYSRHFLDMTAVGVRRWKDADFSTAPYVWMDFGRYPYVKGLRPALRTQDGSWKVRNLGNREGAYPDHASKPPSSFLYLDVGNDFIYAQASEVWVTVEYYDKGTDGWSLEYDGVSGPYTKTETVKLTDSKKWKRKTLRLPDAYFGGRQNYAADLRIGDDYAVDQKVNFFGRVWISKAAPSNKPPALIRFEDVELIPHKIVEIPLITSDPDGQALTLNVDPPVPFAEIMATPAGAIVLQLHPDENDRRGCPYRITVLVTDNGTPPLSDAVTFLAKVKY
jgi:hypothetical protein